MPNVVDTSYADLQLLFSYHRTQAWNTSTYKHAQGGGIAFLVDQNIIQLLFYRSPILYLIFFVMIRGTSSLYYLKNDANFYKVLDNNFPKNIDKRITLKLFLLFRVIISRSSAWNQWRVHTSSIYAYLALYTESVALVAPIFRKWGWFWSRAPTYEPVCACIGRMHFDKRKISALVELPLMVIWRPKLATCAAL